MCINKNFATVAPKSQKEGARQRGLEKQGSSVGVVGKKENPDSQRAGDALLTNTQIHLSYCYCYLVSLCHFVLCVWVWGGAWACLPFVCARICSSLYCVFFWFSSSRHRKTGKLSQQCRQWIKQLHFDLIDLRCVSWARVYGNGRRVHSWECKMNRNENGKKNLNRQSK